MSSITEKVVAYENGELNANEVVDFFAELVRTQLAWQLQGAYGRMTQHLIDENYIDYEGNVLRYPDNIDSEDSEEDDEDEDDDLLYEDGSPYIGDEYYSGTGELIGDSSYIAYLNGGY